MSNNAFGNVLSGGLAFQVESDHDTRDIEPYNLDACGVEAKADPPEEIERIQAGSYQWRGGEGSQTDLLAGNERKGEVIGDHRTPKNPNDTCCEFGDTIKTHERTKISTGLVYMVNRFYEPETGRFTQADPMPLDPAQMRFAQNNRWVYAANDPMNSTDPLGLCLDLPVMGLFLIALLTLLILELIFVSIAWASYGVIAGLYSLGSWFTGLLSDSQLANLNLWISGLEVGLGVAAILALLAVMATPLGWIVAIGLVLAGLAHLVVGILLSDATHRRDELEVDDKRLPMKDPILASRDFHWMHGLTLGRKEGSHPVFAEAFLNMRAVT